MNSSGLAIVTTIRGAGSYLQNFIDYHCAIGFDWLFLFFDDCEDSLFETAASHPRVRAFRNDQALQATWKRLAGNCRVASNNYRHKDAEVMARQGLNVQVALELCKERNIRWLLNIDVDELFLCRDVSPQEHFAMLDAADIRQITYLNHEVVPEKLQHDDIAEEATLFKKSFYALEQHQKLWFRQQFPKRIAYFNYYACGKSAARVMPGTTPAPWTMHAFITAEQRDRFQVASRWRNSLAVRFAGLVAPGFSRDNYVLPKSWCFEPCILHYAICNFSDFIAKYEILGKFSDRWFGRELIAKQQPFHTAARDIVLMKDRARAEDFYRNMVMFSPEDNSELQRRGIWQRIHEPSNLLKQLRRGSEANSR